MVFSIVVALLSWISDIAVYNHKSFHCLAVKRFMAATQLNSELACVHYPPYHEGSSCSTLCAYKALCKKKIKSMVHDCSGWPVQYRSLSKHSGPRSESMCPGRIGSGISATSNWPPYNFVQGKMVVIITSSRIIFIHDYHELS